MSGVRIPSGPPINNTMLTPEEIKEAYRLFYMVKGHFNTTLDTVLSSQNGYFKRLWYDGANGAPLYNYEEQFEKAWAEHGQKILDDYSNLRHEKRNTK